MHQIQSGHYEIGQAHIPLNRLMSAPLKQTPVAQVRVYDRDHDIKDSQTGQFKGSLRVLLYLEDTGEAKVAPRQGQNLSLARAREQRAQPSA